MADPNEEKAPGEDFEEDLKEELEQECREVEWAQAWDPDPRDMLIGTLEGYDEGDTKYGTVSVARIREANGGLRALWFYHSVLKQEWKKANPDVGDRVGVQYLGKRTGKNHSYHMWIVKVDRSGDRPETKD